jgi:cell wall-associated NlpC family hydrolase
VATAPNAHSHRRISFRRFSVAAALVALVSATGAGLAPGPASADSIGDRIASAKAKLDQLDARAEAATERYNAARIRLTADQQKAAAAQRQLAAAQARLAGMQRSVSAFAVAAYKGQTMGASLSVTADSPEVYLEKLTTLQAVAHSQSQVLASLAAAHRAEEQARVTATAALEQQQAATAQMEKDRREILAAAHEEQGILHQLQVRQAEIIRAARERAARIAAQKVAAALAARQAAAAAAAAALASQTAAPAPHVSGSGGASVAVQWAYREIGKPYVWGAAGPDSFDCSGLTMYVWAKAGVYLDHYTGSQWNQGAHVSRDQLQPGDLVFFGSDLHHVGLYIGNGNMIEAPYTGANVRISPAFRSDYAGAVRPGV